MQWTDDKQPAKNRDIPSVTCKTNKQLVFTGFDEAAHYHHSDGPGYFSLLVQHPDKKRQRSYPLSQMATVLPLVNPHQDSWLSQAEFFKPNRRVVNLARLGLLFADLDYYNVPSLRGRDPDSVAWMLLEHCAYEGLPPPSLIISSGRGLQVKWLLEGAIPRQALPRWNACQRVLVGALEDMFGADRQAKDASRVLRLVNTVNTKNDQICRVVYTVNGSDGQPVRYNFDLMCENLFPLARHEIEQQRAARDAREQRKQLQIIQGGKTSNLKNLITGKLAWDRLEDLRKLVILRGGVPVGERTTMLHWQLNFLLLSGAVHSSQMHYEAGALANQLALGWSHKDAELSTLYSKAKAYNAGEKIEFNGKMYPPLYTPKNASLIDLFRITDNEQKQMKTIVSKNEASEREKVRNKARDAERKGWKQSFDEYQQDRKEAGDERMQAVLQLKSQGFKQKYIAEKLGITPARVSQIVKTAKASNTKG